jgi:glycosyltransferase involved in cell wall biosynthesis
MYIGNCLDHIYSQKGLTEKFEVIVADGMSTDRTREIIKEYKTRYINLQMIQNPGKTVPTGLNLAIQRASGEIIIRVDGHTTIAHDYISQCVEALQCTEADNVGGRMSAIGNTPFGDAVAFATSTLFGVGGSRFHYSEKEEWVDSVYMGAWCREVFEKIGLFDEELVRNQDDEFNYRLLESGAKILLSPKIKSVYTVRNSPQALWKQYYQYGYWKVRVLQKHPRQMSLRQFIPPFFVLAMLTAIVCGLLFPQSWVMLALVVGSYLLANLTASIITAVKKGWKHLPLLPVCFMILHVSYGSGFLVGLVSFRKRWGDKKGRVPQLGSNHA